MWGDYRNCDSPPWLVDNLFEHLSHEKFDYILWTGDVTNHAIWKQSRENVLHNARSVAKLFAKYFPGVTVFPALGNHEGVPVNAFPPPFIKGNNSMSWLYDDLPLEWKHSLPNSTTKTLLRGGYYTSLLKPGFRIVSLNTNYCNDRNWWLFINYTDPARELKWLVDVLQKAENNSEKVHIIAHIAPGDSGCLKDWSWNYYRIINRYESTIAGHFFGHAHSDSIQIFYDELDGLNRPVSVGYLAPSVTTYSFLNPGYRVYTIDGFYPKSSWAVLQSETFILNLTEANLSNETLWMKEYSATEAYDMKYLTPSEWNKVMCRVLNDETIGNKYQQYLYKSYDSTPICDLSCRKDLACGMRSARSHDNDLCSNLKQYCKKFM